MAYTINLTDGSIFATIADGTINTTAGFGAGAPLVLVGKNYAGYGEFLDENFIRLLENGANTVAPGNPLIGQLWWNKATGTMQVYTGGAGGFKTIGSATSSGTQPTGAVTGDLWWDTTNAQLKVYNGTSFTLIGPASTSGQGTSGAIVTTVSDGTSDHVIIQLWVQNTIVAIVSKDATFVPQTPITGFTNIGPGIQLSSLVTNALFRGTVANADTVGNISASQFMRNDAAAQNNTSISITNNAGLTLGSSSNGRLLCSGNDVILRNLQAAGNISMQNSASTTILNVNTSTNTVGVTGITNLNANATGNIGSASTYFNTVFATATTALYADVAERFHADETYLPGTVVELGGAHEITISQEELSENVFGVISTRAAYLMNAGAGTDATHPPVAMTGRVPVRVTGTVRKGDRLVSAGSGLARAAHRDEITAYNVIGRSLQNKLTQEEGTIEAIVTIN